jgi:hypothetical protein
MTHSAKSERFGLYGCSIFLHVQNHSRLSKLFAGSQAVSGTILLFKCSYLKAGTEQSGFSKLVNIFVEASRNFIFSKNKLKNVKTVSEHTESTD